MMRDIINIKTFLDEIESDKSIIFDYKKVSNFERELFLSTSTLLQRNYQYDLQGMTRVHYKKLKEEISSLDKYEELIETAFILSSMITARTTELGYGRSNDKKIIEIKRSEISNQFECVP